MTEEVELPMAEARQLATDACLGAGADAASARSLVDATLSAALFGPPTLGFPHLVDYLNAFIEGRINGRPEPRLTHVLPSSLVSDADRGIAQLGFDLAVNDLVEAAQKNGIAIFTQTNSYTAGELGYYVRILASHDLVGLAVTNANAMVVSKPGDPAVYSTNPLAFGFPLGPDSPPMIIDQASSATAFVNVVRAAEEGQPIPEGWAVDAEGNSTTDATKALSGALLPFGGRKGGNVALLVEMLSAGLSGGNWSLDVPDFRSGSTSPAVGLTVIAIRPGQPSDRRIQRAHDQSRRLAGHGVFVPGVTGIAHPMSIETLKIPKVVFDRVSAVASNKRVALA
jgi:(2R)-3-sulfolactate dehydrogenase (NADP+)